MMGPLGPLGPPLGPSTTRDDDAKRARRDDPQKFEGEVKLTHAWVVDVATKAFRDLTPKRDYLFGNGGDATFDIAPDGKSIVLVMNSTPPPFREESNPDIYLVPVDGSGALRNLTPENKGDDDTPRFQQDMFAAATFAEAGDLAAARARASEALTAMNALLIEQPRNARIVLDRAPLAPGHAEGAQDGFLPADLPRQVEKLLVLRVASGVSALDVVDAQLVQPRSHGDLVAD